MGHLKQTNIDINEYKDIHIRRVSDVSARKEVNNGQMDSAFNDQSNLPHIETDKVVLLIVIAILLIAIVFMVHGIINR